MGLSVNNFFHYYIFNFNAKALSEKEKNIAKITSIVLGIFTLGLVHLICRIALYDRSFKIKKNSDDPKTAEVSQEILNPLKINSSTQSDQSSKIKKSEDDSKTANVSQEILNPPKITSSTQDLPTNNLQSDQSSKTNKSDDVKTVDESKEILNLTKKVSSTEDGDNSVIQDVSGLQKELTIDQTQIQVLDKERDLLPLPFLLDLEIESDSPLMKEINPLLFLINFIEIDILEISLLHWINENEQYGFEKEKINDLKNLQKKKLIDERIDTFDSEIQLRERLKRLQYSQNLKVEDLFASWKDSILKYALMMDDELSQLKFLKISELSPKIVLQIFSDRIKKIGKTNTEFKIENVDDLLLIDAPNLTAEDINKHCENLLPSVFCLISTTCIPKIDLSVLSKDQLIALFASEAAMRYIPEIDLSKLNTDKLSVFFNSETIVKNLKKEQLEYCIPLIEEKKLLNHVSQSQVLALDFEKIKLDQQIFDAIFQKNTLKTERILKNLPIKKIYNLHQFFSDAHWKELDMEQILKIIRTESFPITTQKVFDGILPKSEMRTDKCLKQLTAEEINKLHQFFSAAHWNPLEMKQVLEIIRTESFPITTQKVFDRILPKHEVRTDKCLKQLTAEEINKLHQFFSAAHWNPLEMKQVLEIIRTESFPITTQEVFDGILPKHEVRTDKCLKQLTGGEINKLHQFFSRAHWNDLNAEQILEFIRTVNFQISKDLFNNTFPKGEVRTKKCLKQLAGVEINKLHQFFSRAHWDELNMEQILEFIRTVNFQINNDLFNSIFPKNELRTEKCLQQLSAEELYKLHQFFSDAHWKELKPEQITKLNTLKESNQNVNV